MSRILFLIYVFIFILLPNILIGQEAEFLDGKIINAKNEIPIPFATIRIKNKGKGMISNSDGGVKIPYEFQKNGDTLVISSIGYLSKEIPLSNLHSEQVNFIRLTEKVEMLDEVILIDAEKTKRRSAKEIVRLAMEKIPKNYPFTPFSYVGYYRDYQIKEGKYLNLNEAIMEVFDPGFDIIDLKGTRIRIYQYKKNSDFPIDTVAIKPYDYINRSKIISNATLAGQGGNEYTILRLHDAIRNYNINTYDFVNRLDVDLVKNHRFRLFPETFVDSTPLYAIKISKTYEGYKVAGKIYISKDDFEIYKIEYAVYGKRKPRSYQKIIQPNSSSSRTKEKNLGELLYEIIIEYQSVKEIMYPNYISFNNSFEVQLPPKFIPVAVKINHERKRFELTFNNIPLLKDAIKKSNYRLWYQEVKLKIDSIAVKKNNVLLYPENKKLVFAPKRIQSLSKISSKGVAIEVKNVRDISGNVVHEQESVSYNQFREFFVQELKPNTTNISDTLFMIKTRPIFKNQPTIAPKNLSDYWMNTPLKN
ncbi:carboxypeptidase-like regulatory domain-containing protein [Aquimarina sp. AU474]|uniref:carboxypeptidase-like regulatory domain-containing protein n=1 Tax=Aquimarina sp. AU474 TaxID=2108529 RepID=UPI0013592D1A|nr:carboxypeptidase-like regulatory domain-containing protein [Aquimarina sp. AU474]